MVKNIKKIKRNQEKKKNIKDVDLNTIIKTNTGEDETTAMGPKGNYEFVIDDEILGKGPPYYILVTDIEFNTEAEEIIDYFLPIEVEKLQDFNSNKRGQFVFKIASADDLKKIIKFDGQTFKTRPISIKIYNLKPQNSYKKYTFSNNSMQTGKNYGSAISSYQPDEDWSNRKNNNFPQGQKFQNYNQQPEGIDNTWNNRKNDDRHKTGLIQPYTGKNENRKFNTSNFAEEKSYPEDWNKHKNEDSSQKRDNQRFRNEDTKQNNYDFKHANNNDIDEKNWTDSKKTNFKDRSMNENKFQNDEEEDWIDTKKTNFKDRSTNENKFQNDVEDDWIESRKKNAFLKPVTPYEPEMEDNEDWNKKKKSNTFNKPMNQEQFQNDTKRNWIQEKNSISFVKPYKPQNDDNRDGNQFSKKSFFNNSVKSDNRQKERYDGKEWQSDKKNPNREGQNQNFRNFDRSDYSNVNNNTQKGNHYNKNYQNNRSSNVNKKNGLVEDEDGWFEKN